MAVHGMPLATSHVIWWSLPEDWHDDDQCRICPGDEERTWKHPYTPEPAP